MDLNKVILIGRIASEPELRYTPSGIAVTQFRIAVNRPMSAEAKQNGQEKQCDFIDVVAWRQSAEYVSQWLGKGRLIAVEGKLQVRQYQTTDGQNRRQVEVVADEVKSLDRAKSDGDNRDGGGNGSYQQQNQRAPQHQQSNQFREQASRGRAAAPVAQPDNYDDLDDPFADN